MSDQNQNPTPSQSQQPTDSSEGEGIGLNSGLPAWFIAGDGQNRVEPDAGTSEGQNEGGDQLAEGAEGRTEGDGSGNGAATEGGDDVEALRARLVQADQDRTRRAQEAAFLKGRLQELDPYARLGVAISQDPKLMSYVEKVMRGEEPTAGEGKAVSQAAGKAGISPDQFIDAIVDAVDQRVSARMGSQAAAERRFAQIETKARKELEHYEVLQRNPAFVGYVKAMNVAIDNGSLEVPSGEDPNYFAIKEAHDLMIAKNPDYIKAVHNAGVEKGKKSVADKIAGAGPNGTSRGSVPDNQSSAKLDEGDKDRLNMVQAWLRGSSGRRLPSARG